MKETIKMTYVKDTKNKVRYNGDENGISVGVYIDKGKTIPEEILLKLKEE